MNKLLIPYFSKRHPAFFRKLKLLLILIISNLSVFGQFCSGDPIPANQLDLRGNAEYTAGQCPANDIQILGARIETGDPCNSCNPGDVIVGDLIITVHHNTNSGDRYLGVFGNLTETPMVGAPTMCDITRCGGALLKENQETDPHPVTGTSQDLFYGTITFTCGSVLQLSDILLVWTAANGECPVTPANNPNGKYCYNNPVITIVPPLNAMLSAECGIGNTTNIDLTVSGGSGDFSYDWDNDGTGDFDDPEDLTNVPLGAYTVVVRDNVNKDANNNPCTVTQSITFNGPCCEFSVTCPTFTPDPIIVECYADIPTQTSYTEAEFEALGNGDGMIGDTPCGIIEITAMNSPEPICEGNVTRTYTITEFEDADGNMIKDVPEVILNTTTCTHEYTIDLTTAPVVPQDGAATVECPDLAVAPTPPANVVDQCGRPLTASLVSTVDAPDPITCEGTRTYNYTFTDCAQNSTPWKFVYTIDLTTAPVVPQDGAATVECPDLAVAPTPPANVVDQCGRPLTASLVSTVDAPDPITCEGTRTYNYTFTDCAQNSTPWKFVYTIDLTTAPVVPQDGAATVECPDLAVAPTPPANVVDQCGRPLTASLVSTVDAPDPITCEGTRTYNYTFTDCAQNSTPWKFVYTIDLTTAPVVPQDGAATVECPDLAVAPTPPANVVDQCGRPLTASLVSTVDAPDPITCEGTRTYNYTFTDCAQNSTPWKFVYTIDLTTAPVVPQDGAATVECPDLAVAPTPPANVVDQCGRPLTASLVSTVDAPDPITCEGTRTYNYTFTDCAQNSTPWKFVYTIDLTTAPVVPQDGAATVECPDLAVAPTPPANVVDQCGRPLTASLVSTVDAPDPITCEGTRTYNYTFTDCAQNSTPWKFVYTIDLTTAPVVPQDGAATVECPDLAVAPTPPANVVDQCGRPLTASLVSTVDAPDPITCEGTRTYNYTFTDCAQNSTPWKFVYTIDLTTAPVVPQDGAATVECPDLAVAPTPPANVVDQCGRPLTASLVSTVDAPDPITCEGTRTYNYTFTDCAQNSTPWKFVYTIDLTTAPVVPQDGAATVECPDLAVAPTPPANVVDQCGRPLTASLVSTVDAPDPITCEGTRTYNYTFTDCAQNSTPWKFVYTIDLTTAPVVPQDGAATVECPDLAVAPTPPANVVDQCGRPLTASLVSTVDAPDPITCEGTRTYNYTFTDCAQNSTPWKFVYTIDLTTAPVVPQDGAATVECPDLAVTPTPPANVVDQCGRPLTASLVSTVDAPDPITCEGTRTYNYTFTDCAQNSTPWKFVYTIDLTTAPVVPQDGAATVECPDLAVAPTPPANVVDQCGRPLTASLVSTVDAPDPITCEGTRTYNYTFTDCAQNSTPWKFVYTIDLTTAPVVPQDGAATVECPDLAVAPTPPANVVDQCGRPLTASLVSTVDAPDPITCEGTRTYNYTFTDCAQNSTPWKFVYTIDLTTAPVVPQDGAATVECPDLAVAPTPPANVVDQCGRPLTASLVSTVDAPDPITCEGTRTYNYTFTDCAQNSTPWKFVYTIDLTTAPVVPQDGAATVECPDLAVAPTPPANVVDQCGRPLTASLVSTVDAPDPIICEGTRTYNYTFTDCAQNSTPWKFVYTIDLTTAPVVPQDGAATVECPDLAVAPTPPANVVDQCGRPLTASLVSTVDAPDPITCEGTRTYNYTFTDCAQNSTPWKFVYTIDLTTAPVVPQDGAATVECPDLAVAPTPPANVVDQCGRPLTASLVSTVDAPDPITCEGTRTYNYTFTDCAQNSTPWKFVYTIDLTTAPVVPQDGAATVECPDLAVAPTPPANVVDQCGRPLTASLVSTVDAPDPITCEGTRTYNYTFTDCAQNSTPWKFVYTIDLTTAPVVPQDGAATVECPDLAVAPTPPANVVDQCGRPLTASLVSTVDAPDPITCEGTRTYNYTFTDCAQNSTPWKFVYTIDLTTAPVVPQDGAATVECPDLAVAPTPPANVVDQCGRPLTASLVSTVDAPDPITCEGTRTYNYTFTDCAQNSTPWKFVYTIDLTTAPVVPQDGAATVECPDLAVTPTPPANVVDQCGRPLTASLVSTVDAPDPITCEGTRTYNYTFTDCAQNSTPWKFVYTIDLTTAPVVPQDGAATVECPDLAVAPTPPANVVDQCGRPLTASLVSTVDAPDPITCEGTRTYNYTFTDCAQNSTPWKFVYTIDLTTAPVVPQDGAATVECPDLAVTPTPPANVVDQCGRPLTASLVSTVDAPDPITCEGTRTYNYTFTDCAQNSTPWKFVYTIDLTTAPVVPQDGAATVECPDLAVAPTPPANVVDQCGRPLTASLVSTVDAPDPITCEGTRTYNYTFTDCAQNSTPWKFVYTIDLTTAPDAGPDGGSTIACIDDAAPPDPPIVNDACGNLIIPSGPSTVNIACESRTYTWTYADCAGNTDQWSYIYTIDPSLNPINPTCPSPSIGEADEQGPVDVAFSIWKDGFTSTGGCNPVRTYKVNGGSPIDQTAFDALTAPDFCSGDVVEVEMVVTSDCQEVSCTSDFTVVVKAQGIIVSLPSTLPTCFPGPIPPSAADLPPARSQAQVVGAFAILSPCVLPGSITMESFVTGPEIDGSVYTFTRTYLVSAPNAAAEPASEVFEFTWDPNPPTLIGLPEDIELPCGSDLPDFPIVTGIDLEFGPVVVIPSQTTLPASCGERVQRSWTARDECGNVVTGVQNINFVDDEPPMLKVPSDTTVYCGEDVPEPYYEASDNCSSYQVDYKESTVTDSPCEYTITRVWTATDACLNISRDTQIIHVVDEFAPIITIVNPALAGLQHGDEMVMFGCTTPQVQPSDVLLSDGCCTAAVGLATEDVLISSHTCDIFGYYRKWRCTYLATDAAGNETEFSFYMLQYDTTAPVIYNVPADLELDCNDTIPPVDTTVFVQDDCSKITTPNFSEEVLYDPADSSRFTILRTWWATDHCGNRSEATQTINVCGFDMLLATSEVGNTVWEDSNQNGIQDQEEPGVNGINVYLYQYEEGSVEELTLLKSTTTSAVGGKQGQFHFGYLMPGMYKMEFEKQEDFSFTVPDQGEDDEMDSDVNPLDGFTEAIEVGLNELRMNIDAGIVMNSTQYVEPELLSFDVSAKNCLARLVWSSVSEQGLDVFEVQFSRDGSEYTTIYQVEPNGADGSNYVYKDEVKRARGFYRLKMVLLDGSIKYSNVRSVASRCIDTNVTFFPNPFKQVVTVEIKSPDNGDAEILVFDRLGREVSNFTVEVYTGLNRQEINLQQLPPGTYIVKMKINEWVDHKRIIKTY